MNITNRMLGGAFLFLSMAIIARSRKRVYIAPRGLWLTLDAGAFEKVSLNKRTNAVRISLSPADVFTSQARLRVQQPAKVAGVGTYAPRRRLVSERESFVIPLVRSDAVLELIDR